MQRVLERLGGSATGAIAAAAGIVLTLPSLFAGLATDDHLQRVGALGHPSIPTTPRSLLDLFSFADGNPEHVRELAERIGIWTTPPEFRLNFWRPLSSLTHAADYRWWPEQPWLMHLESILLYGLLIYAVGWLYVRFLRGPPRWVAGAAVVLFAFEDAHGVTVGWLSNRNSLIAAALVVLSLIAFDRYSRESWHPGRWLGPILFAAALMAAEAGVGLLAFLFAHVLCLRSGSPRARVASLLPYVVIALLWKVTYAALGYGAVGSDLYVDPGQEPISFTLAFVDRWPIMFLAAAGLPLSDVWTFLSPGLRLLLSLCGWAALGIVALITRPLLRSSDDARFWGLACALSLIPLCATLPADRLLILPSIAAIAYVAAFLGDTWERYAPGSVLSKPIVTLALVWVILHGVVAPVLLPVRTLTMKLLDTTMAQWDSGLPNDAALAEQELIVVNAPNILAGPFLIVRRASLGEIMPRASRFLAVTDDPIDLRRDGEDQMTMTVPTGLQRVPGVPGERRRSDARRFPFREGDRVTLTDFSATVTKVIDGEASEVEFRFGAPCEDPRFRWVQWDGWGYEPFVPPPIGTAVRIP